MASDQVVAYHEAGHAVMAWLQQVRIRKATIIPNEGKNAGHILHYPAYQARQGQVSDSPGAMINQQKQILISLAGPVAQRLYFPHSIRHYQWKSDVEDAFELALHLNGNDSKGANLYLRWIEYTAKGLLSSPQNRKLLEAVAMKLTRKKTLTGSEVEAAIRESYDDQFHQLQAQKGTVPHGETITADQTHL